MSKIICVFLITFANLAAFANEVWIFSTKDQVFTQQHRIANNWKIKHYLIDGGIDFESRLSKGLSNNEAIATEQMKERFKKNKNLWKKQAQSSWQGAINAQSINIKKVPAITFDRGETVIYGIKNLAQALRIYQNRGKQ